MAFLLTEGIHLLDLAGPAQVFDTASRTGCPGYRLRYLAETPAVLAAQGLPLVAETVWPRLGPDDLLLVPGWRVEAKGGSGPGPRGLDLLRAHHEGGGTVASVCAGAFALAEAGLLTGRRCTTHHDLQDALARRNPQATVVRDVLFVVDGRIVTSAGIASGVDLALHLVAVRHGPAAAARAARAMVVYARRNGDAPQESVMLRHRSHVSDVVHRVQDLVDARFAEPLRLADLATAAGVSERTLTRAFVHAIGLSPLRYQQLLRLEHAEHLIGGGSTVEAAARSAGFADARMLRRLRSR
ncbi:MAG: hypothetical protein QG622_3087 [Actinomycetota bacterium]|nr:hypothetical protein [Actinomycetota bacterium]